jgi:hypothetical protein
LFDLTTGLPLRTLVVARLLFGFGFGFGAASFPADRYRVAFIVNSFGSWRQAYLARFHEHVS